VQRVLTDGINELTAQLLRTENPLVIEAVADELQNAIHEYVLSARTTPELPSPLSQRAA
jgi:hypothetical protein